MTIRLGFFVSKFNTSYLILSNQVAKSITQFLLTIVLSRHISPEIYGIYTLSLVYVVFLEIVRDFGFSNLAMQRKDVSPEEFNNNFWILASRGALLSIAMLFVISIYNQVFGFHSHETLRANLMILAFVPFFAGVSAAYNIFIWRNERFKLALGTDFISFFLAANIALFFLHFRFITVLLAFQLISYHIILIFIRVRCTKAYPSFRPPRYIFRDLYNHPPFLGILNLIKAVTANFDSLLIGNLIGAQSLGLYNRAFQMSQVPIQQALESQTYLVLQRSRFNEKIRTVTEVHFKLSVPTIFLLTIFAFNSHEIVIFLYGPQWSKAAYPLGLLSIVAIIRVIEYKAYWFLLTLEQHKLLLKINVLQQIVLVSGMSIGVIFGIQGLCFGLVITSFFSFLVQLYILRRRKVIESLSLFYKDIFVVSISCFINFIYLLIHK